MLTTDLVAAFAIGLAGAGHCLGMCGGIAAAMNLGGQRSTATTLAYHGGRVLSYTALGALLGALAGSINLAQWTLALRYLAGFLMIAMGLAIADWWRGITVLERVGARLWAPVQKLSSRFLPVKRWSQALFLGLCWGLMPCGLIYSALAFSMTAQDPLQSAAMMLVFGAGTLPAMLGTSLGAAGLQNLLRKRGLKLIIALLLIAGGVWSLYLTWSHGGHLNRAIGADGGMHSMEMHRDMEMDSPDRDAGAHPSDMHTMLPETSPAAPEDVALDSADDAAGDSADNVAGDSAEGDTDPHARHK